MHKTIEEIQMRSRKIITGPANVYLVILTFILIYIFNSIAVFAAAMTVFSLLSLHSSGTSYLKFMRVPAIFIIPALLVIAFITPGEKLFWIFSREGVVLAFKTFFRVYASLSVMMYLVITTSIPEILHALKKIRLPEFLAEMMSLVYRTIQIFVDELIRLERSADSRLGFLGKRNMLRTSALLGYSMFIKSMNRAEKLNMAMESRCYSGKIPAPSNNSSGAVYAFAVIAVIFATGVIF